MPGRLGECEHGGDGLGRVVRVTGCCTASAAASADDSDDTPKPRNFSDRHREIPPITGSTWGWEAARQGSEMHMDLMELKEKVTLSREEAAARLHAIADELASNNDVLIEREGLRFVAHVPDQVHLKVEFEIEDDGTELEIELTW
jgi:amphi-Trp domain-containing protein